jgi:hypothetical protein
LAAARACWDEEPEHHPAVWEVVHQRSSAVHHVVEEAVSDAAVVPEVDLSAVAAGWVVDHQMYHPEKEAAAAVAAVVVFPTAVPVAWAAAVPVVVAAAAAAAGEEVG